MVFTLYGRNRADRMRTANCFGIHFAKSEMQYLSFPNQFFDSISNYFDRCIRVNTVLIKDTKRFDTKIA